jgi:hypothetical protein
LDKSAFLHSGTGIPRDIRSFFNLSEKDLARSITLVHEGSRFPGRFSVDGTKTRVRLFWPPKLSELMAQFFPDYADQYRHQQEPIGDQPLMRFRREQGRDIYEIEFIDPKRIIADVAEERLSDVSPGSEGRSEVAAGEQAMARWWDGNPEERYWLEATDRPDIGADLKAPETDDSGRENWRYSLFKETQVGDVVLHYDKRVDGILGWSLVTGPWRSAPIVWAARGSYARRKGTQPYERPGFVIPLEHFQRLPLPLTLNRIRTREGELRTIREQHKQEHRKPLYFPFDTPDKRPIQLHQGYAFKLPRAFLDVFPELMVISDPTEDDFQEAAAALAKDGAFKLPPDGPVPPTPKSSHPAASRFKRDPRVSGHAIFKAEHLCEVDPAHMTFVACTTNKNFVEAHHLIPLQFQEQFAVGLDVVENVVALCPTCHRTLHHGRIADKAKILLPLQTARAEALKGRGLQIGSDQLISFYRANLEEE